MSYRIAGFLLSLIVSTGFASPAHAQYFGRNKVQWDDFDFRVLHTGHFNVYFYPEETEAVEDAARMAERWYGRLSRTFGHRFTEPNPVILYANHPDFQQTNVVAGAIGPGTGGVTEALRNRVVMPLTGVYANTDHVLGHELVHAFQYDIARSRGGPGIDALGRLPLWLVEGMAEYLSLGRDDPHTAMWMRAAALRGDLPTIEQLTSDPRFFPYRYGHALWAYIAGRWGDEAVPALFRAAAADGWEAAVEEVLNSDSETLSRDWITATRALYLPIVQGRQRASDAGRPVLSEQTGAGEMNVAPAVSPDGRYVAFYSEIGLFSVNLYLADVATGEVVRELASAATDLHFDALSFINSAGAWSPDGRRFAFVVFAEGDNRLTIVDIDSGDVLQRISVPGVGQIANPAWSPDGRRIAFSGIAGGISDLYVIELPDGSVRRLTEDRYADLQPDWSPDGATLAFVTDRGPATDFAMLTTGPMRLALLDVASGRIRTLPIFEDAQSINPQYSPDGRDLYFISDRDGFIDLYRYSFEADQVFRLTRLATGVSGITALSPALTVAERAGTVLFSVFEDGGYDVYELDAAAMRGSPVAEGRVVDPVAGVLPPVDAIEGGAVAAYLMAPGELPSSAGFTVTPYDPDLALDYVGWPTVGVAVGRYGTAIGGGTAAYFSDMLGNHTLGVALQANGRLRDIGGQVFYQDRDQRWHWGAVGARVPYLTGRRRIRATTVPIGGQQVAATEVEDVFDRVAYNQAALTAEYPFSTTHRVEATLGFTHIGFDREIETVTIVQGRQVDRDVRDVAAPEGLNLFGPTAALVGDWSYFGFTSPVMGGRYRFEVEPTFGDLTYQALLGDYRRYLFWQPLTLALRGLHYGRYGRDADNDRLTPLYLGYPTLVRGYELGSFDLSDCVADDVTDCADFNRLVGSRIAVANVELRVPLLGTAAFGLIEFPYLPTELAAFVDAGIAWTGDEGPTLDFDETGEGAPVLSAGIASRFNVLGYLILEVYYAYPFQHPHEGWQFGFSMAPGF